ncbi:hypothetical protein [Geothrix sp. 21YS21S-4]|uniref:hypothetical protein n=1 Tax=Geothrix sp. 21YS21S-4 TaxID=3068889 RepID=UPI0027B89C64|nr:hypothetical protein [Geothrix sp. 21YS21S-4]
MRSILRAILAVALLLGGGAGDWAPAASRAAQAHDCCCGAMPPAGAEDACPCPRPENSRTPLRGASSERSTVAVQAALSQTEQAERRAEPRPEPAGWDRAAVPMAGSALLPTEGRGRDPDLGRHLAALSTFRI